MAMTEISKAYEARLVEAKWYRYWLEQGCFTANPRSAKPAYAIVIPPPNVTGMLTLGHVLNNTIQDILARKARMDGKEVLWLPGTDHAGIATQTVVERTLREQGVMKHRDELGRQKLLEHIWQWKQRHGGIIIEQLKRLGASCDWSRERFTMDEHYSHCVQRVFVDLYKRGRIYRGKRMVNWDPAARTALSDEEVIMTEVQGHLWHIKYPLLAASGQPLPGQFLVVATTRPETMLGDEAVAVNPKDERYQNLLGQRVLLPLRNKPIPIIADEAVDPKFGTGCVKVTPAHDPADYEIALRHALPFTIAIAPDGTMSAEAGPDFAGLDRMEARQAVVKKLAEQGLLLKLEPYTHNVGFSQRSNVPIEPYLSEQWFLRYPAVARSTEAVEQGEIKFWPDRWIKTYTHWMRNLRDWCISRQLWWGHRIPVWYNPEAKPALDKLVQVVALTGQELAGPNAKQLRASAWRLVREHSLLDQKFLNDDTGFAILLRKASLAHAFNNHGLANIKLVAGLPALLKHAAKVATLYHQPFSPEVAAVHVFYAALELAGLPYRVRFTVKEFADGLKLYDHQSLELKKDGFDGESPEAHPPKGKLAHRPASNPLFEIRDLVADVNTDPAFVRAQLDCPGPGWVQDPDVLDTWCSSWLWPFATMGWPERTDTLKKFYPTTDLVTGPDIIFFWVARMIMAGYQYMGAKPFANVYFTGIIRDKLGRKMSKSLGNSPDPLVLMDKYGADALRFGVMRSAPLGQDILYDEQHVELGRNFCNKLWNASRFRQLQGAAPHGDIAPALLTSDDKWILLRLDQAIREIGADFAEYRFTEVTQTLYRFFWSEYCDWYVEASKAVLQSQDAARKANTLAVIDLILSHTLRLFHPFLPFITEELWHGLGYNLDLPPAQGGDTIMYAPWPRPLDAACKERYGLDQRNEQLVNAKYELVTLGRNLRRLCNLPSSKKVRFVLKPAAALAPSEAESLKLLLNADPLQVDASFQPPKGTPTARSELGELYLPLAGLIDVEAERARLTKELAKCAAEVEKVQLKLNHPAFVQKVPPAVLAEHQQRLADWQAKRQQVQAALDRLAG